MAEIFSIEHLFTLLMLILLQAVLGFDNLLYISIESRRAPADKQQFVRKMGIGLAVILRIMLLFVVIKAISIFQNPVLEIHWIGVFESNFNVHSMIVLFGGIFIIYTAIKEIFHMIGDVDIGHGEEKSQRPIAMTIAWIVIMNLVFSFDSILSTLALTDVFWIMVVGILVSGAMMLILADTVSEFIEKNKMYEVLGLFILLIVGILLISEGGHLAHIKLFDHPVEAMSKATFYFVIFIIVLVDLVQGRYQKNLLKKHGQ